jgi:diguanylate cyclase (GGDEF)-like protein
MEEEEAEEKKSSKMWKRIFEKRLDAFLAYILSAVGVFLLRQVPTIGTILNRSHLLPLWILIIIGLSMGMIGAFAARFYWAARTIKAQKMASIQISQIEARAKEQTAKLQEEVQRLEKIAKTDQLTRLYNRRELRDRVEQEIRRSYEKREPLSMIIIDIDNFKQVNETADHLVGNKVLQEFAELLREGVRGNDPAFRYEGDESSDPTFRWGGDEFLILGLNNTSDQARMFAERLRKLVDGYRFAGLGSDYPLTMSAGVAEIRFASGSLDEGRFGVMIEDCEQRALWALKEAKQTKNRTVKFESRMRPAH